MWQWQYICVHIFGYLQQGFFSPFLVLLLRKLRWKWLFLVWKNSTTVRWIYKIVVKIDFFFHYNYLFSIVSTSTWNFVPLKLKNNSHFLIFFIAILVLFSIIYFSVFYLLLWSVYNLLYCENELRMENTNHFPVHVIHQFRWLFEDLFFLKVIRMLNFYFRSAFFLYFHFNNKCE